MFKSLALVAAGLLAVAPAARAADGAICYSCPEEWAGWGAQLKAVKAATGVSVPYDAKNSGQALSQIVAEKGNPVADMAKLRHHLRHPGAGTGHDGAV